MVIKPVSDVRVTKRKDNLNHPKPKKEKVEFQLTFSFCSLSNPEETGETLQQRLQR